MAGIEFVIKGDAKKLFNSAKEMDKPKITKAFRTSLYTGAKLILDDTRGNLIENKTTFTGELGTSYGIELSDWKVEIGTNKDYAPDIEYGRPAGKRPSSESIKKWARLKLKVPMNRLDRASYLIARKIERLGTKPQPHIMPAFRNNENRIIDILQRTLNAVAYQMIGGK